MKLLEFLKRPINKYNNRSNQKRIILETERQLSNQVTPKKINYSLKFSKPYLNTLFQKKQLISDAIKSTKPKKSQQTGSKKDDETFAKLCFDNFAYGNFISTETSPYLKGNNSSDEHH